ncbi:AMP-binding protein [Microvirga sp. 2YAF29]|uniref:AMP-binding protein n=1 Tax=Microvirga sp. 2YAF29 TaxID=3233031 RepID=UPI003F963DA7
MKTLDWRIGLTPNAPFLIFHDDDPISFSEIRQKAGDYASSLRQAGIRAGDRVVLLVGNRPEHVALWFAINLLGAIDVPVNTALSGKPLEHTLNLVEAETVIIEASLLPALHDMQSSLSHVRKVFTIDADSDRIVSKFTMEILPLVQGSHAATASELSPTARYSDVMSILFTSGTSGPSKGVMLTHAQAFLTARQTVEGLWVAGHDTFYCAHPLFHMSPRFCVIYASLLTGAKIHLDRKFSAPEWIDRIRATGATVTIGHGPLLEMIFSQPERPDDADTKLARVGTSPFPKSIASAFERRFGVKGIETWGMTEVNIPCWHPKEEPLKPGSCGKVRHEWYDFRIVDPDTDEEMPQGQVGEFAIRPKLPGIISPGYFANPDATVRAWRNLWFHTGDSGYVDADGWVYFVDRLGDRIRRRAENISSYEIEAIANAFPAIEESAAIGVPSEYESDDDIKLCVVVRPGFSFSPENLLVFLASNLPHYMIPRYIEVLDEMPRTPTKKTRKVDLRVAGVTSRTWDRKAHGIDLKALIENARAAPQEADA